MMRRESAANQRFGHGRASIGSDLLRRSLPAASVCRVLRAEASIEARVSMAEDKHDFFYHGWL